MFARELSLCRYLRGIYLQNRFYRKENAGIQKRLKIFKNQSPDLSKFGNMTEEELEDLELDAANVPKIAADLEREEKRLKKKIEFQRIERQFFEKKKNPNFLLWSEKEQIRELHNTEPDTWTFQKLSESFPATPDIIKKIVKAQWKLRSAEEIRRHDERVVANWKAYEAKNVELPPYLDQHLKSFVSRDRLLLPKATAILDLKSSGASELQIPPTKHTGFIDIVLKRDERSATPAVQDADHLVPSHPSESYVLGGNSSRRRRHVTLSEMRRTGRIAAASSNVDGRAEESSKPLKQTLNPSLQLIRNERYRSGAENVELLDDEPEEIPMKITIPKEKWKKGAVYKVNNCFYDHYGEFLYKI